MQRRISLSWLLAPAVVAYAFMAASPAISMDLKSKVTKELSAQYRSQFNITVTDPGVITIKGTVLSYWDKRNVYAIVSRVEGVTNIKDELAVETDMIADKTIEANIEQDLIANRMIAEPKKIHVNVERGLVILSGTVSFAREKNVAEDLSSWHPGVLSVANELSVLPPRQAMSDENLTAIIKGVIDRDFLLEKDSVQASCLNGRVTLTGSVKSLWAKHAMAREIQGIQWINEVDNQLRIKSPFAAMN